MDVKELEQFEAVYQPSKEITYCWGVNKYVQLSTEEDHTDIVDHANYSLRIWQAAIKHVIPEGFAVVPIEVTPKQIEAYMKGKFFHASMGEHRKFVDRLSKDYKAMIEAAQE